MVEIDAARTYMIDRGREGTCLVEGEQVASFATAVPSIPLHLHLNHGPTDTWLEVGYPPPTSLGGRFDSVNRADP